MCEYQQPTYIDTYLFNIYSRKWHIDTDERTLTYKHKRTNTMEPNKNSSKKKKIMNWFGAVVGRGGCYIAT